MDKIRRKSVDELFNAILSLKDLDECYAFFEDACTIKEILDIAGRYEVAGLLDEGKNYSQISAATGASTGTISRVNKALGYGTGGYRIVLDRRKTDE